MCMYSTPIVPAVRLAQGGDQVAERDRAVEAEEHGRRRRSRSRSASDRPKWSSASSGWGGGGSARAGRCGPGGGRPGGTSTRAARRRSAAQVGGCRWPAGRRCRAASRRTPSPRRTPCQVGSTESGSACHRRNCSSSKSRFSLNMRRLRAGHRGRVRAAGGTDTDSSAPAGARTSTRRVTPAGLRPRERAESPRKSSSTVTPQATRPARLPRAAPITRVHLAIRPPGSGTASSRTKRASVASCTATGSPLTGRARRAEAVRRCTRAGATAGTIAPPRPAWRSGKSGRSSPRTGRSLPCRPS